MIDTPTANRLHIGIFGKRNAGKSSIINSITNQDTALVSNVKGTTTDPVYKAMELLPIGPVVIIDTAGIDDVGDIGELRIQRTREVVNKTDIALLIFSIEDISDSNNDFTLEKEWFKLLTSKNIPIIGVLNKCDIASEMTESVSLEALTNAFKIPFIKISASNNKNIDGLKKLIISNVPSDYERESILGDIVKPGDKVLLVAPQDIQAPKGRLILPQVQVIRDLLDFKAIPITVTLDNLDEGLKLLNDKPDLVITDSQVFEVVNSKLNSKIPLTSFSILMSRYKGELEDFVNGAKVLRTLKASDKILIAEACTHHALKGDIAKEKLPNWIRRINPDVDFVNCSGKDFPQDLHEFKLVIHCGSCMLNRAEVLSRIDLCKSHNVAITNFGTAIAELNGILDRVTAPLR